MSTALLLLGAAAAGFIAGALLRAGALRLKDGMTPVAAGPWWRRPGVELLTAVAFASVVAVDRRDGAELVLGLVLVAFLVPICLIDLDHMVIPNRLTLPAAPVAIALGSALDPGGEAGRLVAGVVAGAALALPSLLRPSGIGMGDAKLVAVLGLFLGSGVAAALAAAFLAGSLAGLAIIVRTGLARGRRTPIAFGPFLALGGLVGVLAGDELVALYVKVF